jgi:hypothetical protein
VIQSCLFLKAQPLVQVLPAEETAGELVPIGTQYGRLAEGVVDVAFNDGARIVKDRADIIVAVLGDVQTLVESPVSVGVDELSAPACKRVRTGAIRLGVSAVVGVERSVLQN